MKLNIRKTAATLLLMLFSVMMFASTALAANIPSIQFPVEITAEGALPNPAEIYVVRLSANNESNPMPNSKLGGSYDLKINGPGNAAFPLIEFESVGIYTYTIKQLAGANPDCLYDARSYTARVSVTNGESEEYIITITIREDGTETKPDKIEFHNVYKSKDDPSPQPTPTSPPGPIVPTGVVDHWIIYLISSALLLLASVFIIKLLRRKEDK